MDIMALEEGLDRLRRPAWTHGEIEDHYGYGPATLSHFGFNKPLEEDRYAVERVLVQERGVLSCRLAAAELSLDETSMSILLGRRAELFPQPPFAEINGDIIFLKDQLPGWIIGLTR